MIPAAKLGWVAGVVDLKGKIINKSNRSRRNPQLVLVVESKDFAIIRELSSLTGVRPDLFNSKEEKEWMRKGCSEHCPEQHVHTGRYPWKMPAIARWSITGAGAVVVLYNILPFMHSDRGFTDLMDEVMEFVALTGPGSGMTLASLRRLRDLGWELPEKFELALEARDTQEDVTLAFKHAIELAEADER